MSLLALLAPGVGMGGTGTTVAEPTTGSLDYTVNRTLDFHWQKQWNMDETLTDDDLTGTVR